MTLPDHIHLPGAELVGRAADDAEWHAMRRAGIGGSDAAAIMGESPFTQAREVWESKTGRAAPGAGNAYTSFGHLMERAIIEAVYPEATPGDDVGSFRSCERAHMLGNFDALGVDGTLIEIKTTEAKKKRYWKVKACPRHYWCQVQHYLYVLGLDRAKLTVCFVSGDRATLVPLLEAEVLTPEDVLRTLCTHRTYDIERDEDWLARYLREADAFWTKVEADQWDEPAYAF